jgi:ABC-2 type transport system permease protein
MLPTDDAFFIVGNAVQVCGMSCVYGMTMAVANERWFGTLGPLLASPANRAAVFLGRGVPVFANGLLVSAFGFAVGAVLLGFRPPLHSLPALLLVVCLTTRLVHDVRHGARLHRPAQQGLLLRGEPRLLPDAPLLRRQHPVLGAPRLDERHRARPAAHARHRGCARDRRRRRPRRRVRLLWTELGIAAAYAAAGYLFFRLLETASRRSAVLDAF